MTQSHLTAPRPGAAAPTPVSRTGGQILVDQLLIHGVQHIFCVPGESYLAVLDALVDTPIHLTVCRQEGGAAMMAEAQGKLTGRPGVCFVTRGPGATNAAAGLHIAMQDASPMIVFVGQIARTMREREAFQELNYRAVFGTMVKWVTEVDDAERLPEIVARAFSVASSGRPGPVVVALPEDMLRATALCADACPYGVAQTGPTTSAVQRVLDCLAAAQRPVMLVGGSTWTAAASEALADFAHVHAIPVVCSFRRQMLMRGEHPCYAGELGLGASPAVVAMVQAADVIVLLGARLSEVPAQGYNLLRIPKPEQTLIHVYPDPNELGKVYQAELAIVSRADQFCQVLAQAPASDDAAAHIAQRRIALAAVHAAYLQWSDARHARNIGDVHMASVMQQLPTLVPANSIVCNGAGNFSIWLHRYWRYQGYGTQLAPTSGSMGYGLPAAIGAQSLARERTVLCFTGDGDFLMHGQELATAVQYQLPIIIILADNGMYGTIRMHQEREYPGRVIATELRNPDFCALALSYGAHGERVERTAEFAPALQRALRISRSQRKPALLHCLVAAEALTPMRSLSEIRLGATVAVAAPAPKS